MVSAIYVELFLWVGCAEHSISKHRIQSPDRVIIGEEDLLLFVFFFCLNAVSEPSTKK